MSHFDKSDLQTLFIALAEVGDFLGAAERIHLQSHESQDQLESDIGMIKGHSFSGFVDSFEPTERWTPSTSYEMDDLNFALELMGTALEIPRIMAGDCSPMKFRESLESLNELIESKLNEIDGGSN